MDRASLKRRELSSGRGGENFKVAVRVRPLIQREIKASSSHCVEVNEDHKAVTITKPESRKRAPQIGIDDFGELIRSDVSQAHNFFYDLVFGPSSTQDVIFEVCVKSIVDSVLRGYNGSIIASGQTGSGKTYTIEGGQDETKGIIPRATELVFQYIENCPSRNDRFLVRTSFLEIYNERISDLLDPARENLRIREDGLGGVFVEGLSEHVVRGTDGVMALLRQGAHFRTTAPTRMNKESSRSHAVFTVIVEHAECDGSGGNVVTIGKLRLVDLAGSERLDVEAQSKQQEETKNINVSLHTFGKVVTALTTSGVKYIPYRDSKLTRLLQDCLGGNCKTTLIATITPVSSNYTESLNTLKFAKRAKSIKNTAQINKDMSQKALLSAYQQEITKLKQQLEHRDNILDHEEIERLEREREEAQKEKAAVLEAHQQLMSQAQAERDALYSKIADLEKVLLHGGSRDISESEEFQKAVQMAKDRIRHESESQLESRLAELEAEKKRLQDERAEVEKQREYFTKLREELQPGDGQKDEPDAPEEIERGSSPVKHRPVSAENLMAASRTKKPATAPSLSSSRPPPLGAHIPTSPFTVAPRRIGSVDAMSRSPRNSAGIRRHAWIPSHPAVADYERPIAHEAFGARGMSAYSLQTHNLHLDDASATALREYIDALAHPSTGIPCQEASGVHIFTGSAAVKWFVHNMEGVTNVQVARDVGQRLMDLNVFTEIQGGTQFFVSDSVYYQFCEPVLTTTSSRGPILSRPCSSVSLDPGFAGSHRSLYGTHRGSLASASEYSSWGFSTVSSTASLESIASLQISGDLLEHFGLSDLQPSQLHVAAIYGDRSKLKVLARELSVDSLDAAGHTPLMYAVMGKQSKCCLQLVHLGANVNSANQVGQTPLLLATSAEYSDIIKVLLKNGAQTHYVDQKGHTVYHIAAKSQNYRCLEYLCKYASEPHGINERDHHYHTPLHIAVTTNLPRHARRLLIAKADLGVSDENGRTALHYAVSINSLPCVQAITEAVPNDINLVDTEGWSALHLACHEGCLEAATYLLSCTSCDINLRDQNGYTPLHITVLNNAPVLTKALVQHGAKVTAKDIKEKTALQYCMDLDYADCALAIQMCVSGDLSSALREEGQ